MDWAELQRLLPLGYWDVGVERYAGETVLDDYRHVGDGAHAEARLLMVRFLAVQYLTNRLRGDWPEGPLRMERSAALNAFGTGLLLDRELRMLRQAVQQVGEERPWAAPSVALVLTSAGMAEARGHGSGALALYRIAWEGAMLGGYWAFASAAALGMAGLARGGGDERASRRWQRRGRAYARRARLAPEA